jgi:hypothetical protein
MPKHTLKNFDQWLTKFGAAWQAQDPHLVLDLFAGEIVYYESPHLKPAKGKGEVMRLWQDVPNNQSDVTFKHQVLAVNKNIGIIHWQASLNWHATNKRMHLDGIFVIKLDDSNLCTEFRQWESVVYD